MRILFCGTGWLEVVDCIRQRLDPEHTIEIWDRTVPLAEALADVDVILPSNMRIDAAAIAAPRRLALIQQPAAGTEGIDVDAARARGVPVCNAPATNHVSVAEAALLLILSLARRLPVARRELAAARIGGPLGIELRGKALGIVGLGRSGSALADAARGLGMEVLSVRSRDSRAALLAMLARCDVVSLHCPETPATRGMIDAEALAAMKPGALLVNCARGGIVDRAALEAALGSGHLGGVGLDVFWREPWDPADPLLARDDVVALPHVAGSTAESFARIADLVAGNVHRVARGDEPLHRLV